MEVDYRRHRLESSESESEASRSEEEVEVERRRKVKYFRVLFGGLITVRRAVELRQSQTEVLQEHKLFRIMQEWRKMAVIGRKKQL